MTTPGATSTAWNWTQQAPAASDLDSGSYSFYVQATDADNVASAYVRRDFYHCATGQQCGACHQRDGSQQWSHAGKTRRC